MHEMQNNELWKLYEIMNDIQFLIFLESDKSSETSF